MEQYGGIDVSLDSASVCIVDAQGKILKEAKVACEPEALTAWLAAHLPMCRRASPENIHSYHLTPTA